MIDRVFSALLREPDVEFVFGKNGATRIYTPPYCNCEFPDKLEIDNFDRNITHFFKCRCGENVTSAMEWSLEKCQFSNESAYSMNRVRISDNIVTFHPVYSEGTAVVRGNQPLKANKIHFWEFRTLTALEGTDVMFGVATDKLDVNACTNTYASVLGADKESWGLSYTGHTQHNGDLKWTANSFSKGCLIGVCVDRIKGTLEFQLNRRSLGVIYENIPTSESTKLYPMISCTTAKTAVRLLNAISVSESLALRSFKALSLSRYAMQEFLSIPGSRVLSQRYWFLSPYYFSITDRNRHVVTESWDLCDQTLLSDTAIAKRKKKMEEEKLEAVCFEENLDNIYDLPNMSPLWKSKEKDQN